MSTGKRVTKMVIWALFANILVAAIKFISSVITGSLGLLSDALHSSFDVVSSIIAIYAVHMSAKPADLDHPYGHEKYEFIASVFISALLFVTCFEVIMANFERIMTPTPIKLLGVGIFAVVTSTFINIVITFFELKIGKEEESPALIADSQHTKSDILASTAVGLGLIFSYFNIYIADSISSMFVAVIIAHTGYTLIKEASDILSGKIPTTLTEKIRETVLKVNGVLACHKIRAALTYHGMVVNLHILVSPEISVKEGHKIAHNVSNLLKEKFGEKTDTTIHVEGYEEKKQ